MGCSNPHPHCQVSYQSLFLGDISIMGNQLLKIKNIKITSFSPVNPSELEIDQ